MESCKLKTVMDYRSFDTFMSPDACLDLTQYLSINVPFKALVLIASFDDMAFCLCDNAKKILTEFGSKLIADVKFRSNWVLVGESGLMSGLAIEKLVNKGDLEFAPRTEIEGCASVPFTTAYVPVSVDIGLEHSKCGVPNCGFDELALHVFTGQQSTSKPKICVAGHHVVWPGVKGGRGFNLAVVEPLSKDVVAVRHFDSYITESSNIDLFLESISPNHLLIGVVHDEATNCLQSFTRNLFQQFGVNLVNELRTRSVMYFVGQRGLHHSPYQEISHAQSVRHWPVPIDKRLCLPAELSFVQSAHQVENVNHSAFCYKHGGYGDFCYVHHKNEAILPVREAQVCQELDIMPILILAGLNHNALLKTLRSLIVVPGLIASNVIVAHFTFFDEFSELSKLFGFRNLSVDHANGYSAFLEAALDSVWTVHPEARYIILIDEEVIVTEAFLEYMCKVSDFMKGNDVIGAASAWNPYGFPSFASDDKAIYYVDDFVGMAMLLSKKFYAQQMVGRMHQCCSRRSWRGWFFESPMTARSRREPFVFLMPEVSRADYYRNDPYDTYEEAAFLGPKRLLRTTGLPDVEVRSLAQYEEFIRNALRSAVNVKDVLHDFCWYDASRPYSQDFQRLEHVSYVSSVAKKSRLLVFASNSTDDYSVLHKLIRCFGFSLPVNIKKTPGLFKGVMRLSLNGRPFYLLSTTSAFINSVSSGKWSGKLDVVYSTDI